MPMATAAIRRGCSWPATADAGRHPAAPQRLPDRLRHRSGFSYFPSLAEVLVTAGMFAVEVLGYIIITRSFPVLPREDARRLAKTGMEKKCPSA
jgi:Ni/Fe-hydrogenase subunit HybB-like protein